MTTYIIFDGDKDKWAYAHMKGWDALPTVPFTFTNAHDLDNMTARAQGEEYVKRHLRARMEKSTAVVVLIGESTKNLFKFVRWELELAKDLGLPIIAVNLNGSRKQDDLCPPIIRDEPVVHVPFKLDPIKYALTNWPNQFRKLTAEERKNGPYSYSAEHYRGWKE